MDSQIIHLKYPVKFQPFSNFYITFELKKIELRRPKVKDMIGLQFNGSSNDYASMITLISRISGAKESVVKEIDIYDMGAISEAINKMSQSWSLKIENRRNGLKDE